MEQQREKIECGRGVLWGSFMCMPCGETLGVPFTGWKLEKEWIRERVGAEIRWFRRNRNYRLCTLPAVGRIFPSCGIFPSRRRKLRKPGIRRKRTRHPPSIEDYIYEYDVMKGRAVRGAVGPFSRWKKNVWCVQCTCIRNDV